MPPSGHLPPLNTGRNAYKLVEPYYSNEDIDLLHHIVLQAETLLSDKVLPTNALFSAYYSLLEQYQVNPDHDNRYARVLFKIGGIRGSGTLYEKFEEVLSRMGIEIEFFETPAEELRKTQSKLEDSHSVAAEANRTRYTQTSKRRNSESSIWNPVGEAKAHLHKKRNNSFSSGPRPKDGLENTEEITKNGSKFEHHRRSFKLSDPFNVNNIQHVGAWLASGSLQLRDRSPSDHKFSRIKESRENLQNEVTQESLLASNDYHGASATSAPTSPIDEITTDSTESIKEEMIPESEYFLDMKVSLMVNRRLALFMKSKLQVWNSKAKKIRDDNAGFEILAINQYCTTVLRAALHNWRIETKERKATKDIERYFQHLQDQATKARDLCLLYVAFSHWSNFSSNRAQQTAEVRKYLIQNRIFNAWRDITAVDELKIRRQILKKFFYTWMFQKKLLKEQINAACRKYEIESIHNYFCKWRYEFLVTRAYSFWTEKSKCFFFFEWALKARSLWQKDYEADIFKQKKMCVRALLTWTRKTRILLTNQQKVKIALLGGLGRRVLLEWFRKARFMPTIYRVETQIAIRKVTNIYFIWLHRTRQERKASHIDRLKTLREALINWRHKTRGHLLRTRFDKYIVEHVIYKWILRARLNLGIRLGHDNCLRNFLFLWTRKWQAARRHHYDQVALAQEVLARKMQNKVLLQWYSCMSNLQQAGLLAENFYQPRILQSVIYKWVSGFHHFKKLNRWSQDAGYYLLASRVLKKWKLCTEYVRREKRRNSYAQVRRMTKINKARYLLRIWKSKAQNVMQMILTATEMNQNRIDTIGIYIFDRWHSYAEELLKIKIMLRDKSLQKYITIWQDKSQNFGALQHEALIVYQEQRTSKILKKWSLHYLHIRARVNYASNLREKNIKKNFRRIFLYWCQQVKHRKFTTYQPLSKQDYLRDTFRNDNSSELGEQNEIERVEKGLELTVTPISIPGYLNTPSKRSERILAAVTKYSTTPKTPNSLPHGQFSYAMYSGGLGPSIRQKKILKSKLGISNLKKNSSQRLSGHNTRSESSQL